MSMFLDQARQGVASSLHAALLENQRQQERCLDAGEALSLELQRDSYLHAYSLLCAGEELSSLRHALEEQAREATAPEAGETYTRVAQWCEAREVLLEKALARLHRGEK